MRPLLFSSAHTCHLLKVSVAYSLFSLSKNLGLGVCGGGEVYLDDDLSTVHLLAVIEHC